MDLLNFKKSPERMNEESFWSIISQSLEATQNEFEQERFLINALTKLSPKEMIGFRLKTDQLLYDTYSSEMWCAGYIMNGGCLDDDPATMKAIYPKLFGKLWNS